MKLIIRRCGGTGRRKGLKIPRWQHRTGSIPVTGTRHDKSEPYPDWRWVRIYYLFQTKDKASNYKSSVRSSHTEDFIKATPHKDHNKVLHTSCLHIFRHTARILFDINSMPAENSYNLPKNLTAQYAHNLYAVLPLFSCSQIRIDDLNISFDICFVKFRIKKKFIKISMFINERQTEIFIKVELIVASHFCQERT